MTVDKIKFGLHDGFLFVLAPRFTNGDNEVYVLVDAGAGTITAYGPCPNSALEAAGRDAGELTLAEYANRLALAAVDGYFIDGGRGMQMIDVPGIDRRLAADEYSRFFSAETAAVAAAVAGWPEPVVLFRSNGGAS